MMHQKFLYATLLFGLTFAFNAQASGLFPELQKKEKPAVSAENTQEVDLFDEQEAIELNKNIEDEFKEIDAFDMKEPIVKPTPKQETEKEAEEKKNKKSEQIFEIHPHDVQITMPPTGPDSQFCTGQMTLENKTEYPLVQMKALFTYSGIKVPYYFNNVSPNDSVTGQIILMGPLCQDLLKPVPAEAEICEAEGISESECKSMVKYILK